MPPLFKKLPHSVDYLRGKWIFIGDAFFGDNGKGKVKNWTVYFLQEICKLKVGLSLRPNGGDNAGHEVFAPWGPNGLQEAYKGNVVPMGILQGVPALIGPGAVFSPKRLFEEELKRLAGQNIDIEKVLISYKTNIILPHYTALEELDAKLRGRHALGTTKKSIGQTYEYRAKRAGIRVYDLLGDMSELKEKILLNYKFAGLLVREYCELPDFSQVLDELMRYKETIRKMAVDEQALYKKLRQNGETGVAEMGQGTGLDNIFGNFGRYRGDVTSSLTTIPGGVAQAGLTIRDVAYSILVVKGPYYTRVGNGDLPTEMPEEDAALFRGKKGELASEYGVTTGRPRRCAYPDLEFLKQAIALNGPDCLCLTKMDKTANKKQLKVWAGHYEEWPGWNEKSIQGAQTWEDFPIAAQKFIDRTDFEVAGSDTDLIQLVSTGPSLQDMAILDGFLRKPR